LQGKVVFCRGKKKTARSAERLPPQRGKRDRKPAGLEPQKRRGADHAEKRLERRGRTEKVIAPGSGGSASPQKGGKRDQHLGIGGEVDIFFLKKLHF